MGPADVPANLRAKHARSRARAPRWASLPLSLGLSLGVVALLPACEGWTLFERGKERPRDGQLLTIKVLGTKACDAPAGASSAKLLGVEVELTSFSATNVPASFYYATLDDGVKSTYRALSTGCEPLLAGSPLAYGQTARGFLTFPVQPLSNESQRNYRLRYDPRLPKAGTDPKARVEVPLGSATAE